MSLPAFSCEATSYKLYYSPHAEVGNAVGVTVALVVKVLKSWCSLGLKAQAQ